MIQNRDHDYLYLEEEKYLTKPKHTTLILEKLLKDISFGDKYLSLWDIGCSNGSMLNYLVKQFPNCNFFGSDIIPESIELAKQKTSKVINYFSDDITQKNVTQLNCDVIISVGVLQIYDNIKEIIENYISRTADEGYIFLVGPFGNYDVDVKISYRDNKNTKTSKIDQGGWNVWSINYIQKELSKINYVKKSDFIPINFPKNLNIKQNEEDPLRSWTVNVDGQNKFLNALILQDLFVLKLKINKQD